MEKATWKRSVRFHILFKTLWVRGTAVAEQGNRRSQSNCRKVSIPIVEKISDMLKVCQECIFEFWENLILRMNGEILKLWILPEMHLIWCWSANAMGAFQHISILRTYFCNLTFSLTLLCFHLRTSQSMLGKEFRSSKRTVQLYLTHRFNTTIINPISHPH